MVLIGVVAAITGLTGHSDSWHYGHDHADLAAGLIGESISEQSACRSVAGIGTSVEDVVSEMQF
jgi:hypothetical protein